METKKINSVRKYKNRGYILVKESIGRNPDIELHSAYSYPDLYYIGNNKDAYQLWNKFGIAEFYPAKEYEPIKELSVSERAKKLLLTGTDLQLKHQPVCSMGWSERDQKWYGWSHRAIDGFAPGSEVKKGDCGYFPVNKQDAIEDSIGFWSDEYREIKFLQEEIRDGVEGFWLQYIYNDLVPNEKMRGETITKWCDYPGKWGRGEWTAETWEDAKQMAIDFAQGVG